MIRILCVALVVTYCAGNERKKFEVACAKGQVKAPDGTCKDELGGVSGQGPGSGSSQTLPPSIFPEPSESKPGGATTSTTPSGEGGAPPTKPTPSTLPTPSSGGSSSTPPSSTTPPSTTSTPPSSTTPPSTTSTPPSSTTPPSTTSRPPTGTSTPTEPAKSTSTEPSEGAFPVGAAKAAKEGHPTVSLVAFRGAKGAYLVKVMWSHIETVSQVKYSYASTQSYVVTPKEGPKGFDLTGKVAEIPFELTYDYGTKKCKISRNITVDKQIFTVGECNS